MAKGAKKLVNAVGAAKIMGVNERYVRTLCEQGRLDHIKVGSIYLINAESAKKWERNPYGRGRPPKKR